MSDRLYRRWMLLCLTVTLFSAAGIVAIRAWPRPEPCAREWALPVYRADGSVATEHLTAIMECFDALDSGPSNPCPPAWSEWHQFIAPDGPCD